MLALSRADPRSAGRPDTSQQQQVTSAAPDASSRPAPKVAANDTGLATESDASASGLASADDLADSGPDVADAGTDIASDLGDDLPPGVRTID
jgi:hypothetical protein